MTCTPATGQIGCFYDQGAAVYNLGAYLPGAVSDDEAFSLALGAAMGTGGVLYVPERSTAYAITSGYTVPPTVVLQVAPGALLHLTTTLTLYGGLEAGPYAVFDVGTGGSAVFAAPMASGYAEWWGIDGTDDHVEIQAAVSSGLGRVVLLPGKTYHGPVYAPPPAAPGGYVLIGSNTQAVSNLVIEAYGATLTNMQMRVISGTDLEFRGGFYYGYNPGMRTNYDAAIELSPQYLAPPSRRIRITDVVIQGGGDGLNGDGYGTGITIGYGCEDIWIHRCRIDGATEQSGMDLIDSRGKRVTISDCELSSLDDGIVLKAPAADQVVSEHVISNCTFFYCGTALAFGTQVSGVIRGVTARNLTCVKVSRAIAIKPGSDYYGYYGGLIEDVTVTGLSIVDDGLPAFYLGPAARYTAAVYIQAQFYTTVRDIKISDVVVRARGVDNPSFVVITANNHLSTLVREPPVPVPTDADKEKPNLVDGVTISNCRFTDLGQGSTTGPGAPVERGIIIQEVKVGTLAQPPVIRRVDLSDVVVDGCSSSAVLLDLASSKGEVRMRRTRLRNFGAHPDYDSWGLEIKNGTLVARQMRIEPSAASTRALLVSLSAAPADQPDLVAESDTLEIGSWQASQAADFGAWIAPSKCCVISADVVVATAVMPDPSANTVLSLARKDAVSSTPFASISTASVTLPREQPVPFAPTPEFSQSSATFQTDQVLEFTKTAGAAISEARVSIRYLPC